MALAISILSCLGAAASEGAQALLSTVFALAASPAKAEAKPKADSRGSKTGGGVERAAHAGAAATSTAAAAAAAAASKRASGKSKQASGRPSNKNISGSGNGSARVLPAKKSRNGKGGGGGAASAAVAGSGGGVHSAEPVLDEKAALSQLLDQFESLASMMGQKVGLIICTVAGFRSYLIEIVWLRNQGVFHQSYCCRMVCMYILLYLR